MGADIHMYLEFVDSEDWVSSVAKFSLDRNYTIFCLMAGVRSYERSRTIYPPRGLPEKVGWEADHYNTLYVIDKDTNEEHYTSRETAEGWVERGISKWVDDNLQRVTHPDWHSHSWLTAEEFRQVKDTYETLEFPRAVWYQKEPEMDLAKEYMLPEGATLTDVAVSFSKDYQSSPYRVEVGPKTKAVFPPRYEALLAALKALGENGRIVFWFDN